MKYYFFNCYLPNLDYIELFQEIYLKYFMQNISIYFFLLVAGARVNAKDSKWLTPLHRAVASCSEV